MDDAEKIRILEASIVNLGRLLPVGMEVRFHYLPDDVMPHVTITYPDGQVTEGRFTTRNPIFHLPKVDAQHATEVH
jgi:hypothetical protein